MVQGPVDQSSSQSADAARAARMSRVGTKAGMETCEVLEIHNVLVVGGCWRGFVVCGKLLSEATLG